MYSSLYNDLMDCRKRFILNYGGTAAGKSFAAAQKEVNLAATSNIPFKTLVIRKVGNTLRDSVIPAFRARIEEEGLYEAFRYNKTDRTLTHKDTGCEIIFRGLDDPDKLKSFEGLQRILVEEAAELELEDFLELNRRARGREGIQITLTFNPTDEEHWLKKHFFDRDDPDAAIFHSTYKNNPHLTEQDREQIERLRLYDNNQYRVYALGEWGVRTNNAPWLYAFEEDKHVVDKIDVKPSYPVYVSFDFNCDPLTCIAVQMSPNLGETNSFVHIIREFSGKYNLQEICRQVHAYFLGLEVFVTGDASGSNSSVAGDSTHFTMIQSYLDLARRQLNLNTRNLPHHESRLLVNTLFANYPDIKISREGCPLLINDCIIARTDDKSHRPGTLLKDRGIYKMDLFDAMRYFFQTYFKSYASKVAFRKQAA